MISWCLSKAEVREILSVQSVEIAPKKQGSSEGVLLLCIMEHLLLTSIIRSARKVAKDFMAINSSETSAESMVMNDLIGELENAEPVKIVMIRKRKSSWRIRSPIWSKWLISP